ncbi:cobyrinate a,c-diamide synthase [Acidobacteria bacterium AH-259-O06]|nr:cobyrinate a,c-diamide synthase [Acidobacteria bacterium AH-259-O06]
MKHAFVIAGTHSGVGKTSVSIGIMRALTRRGFKVQPFKVGPDFIDPGHHRRATGQISRNLDGWMLSQEFNVASFQRHLAGADVGVIEGVMGLFDGYDGQSESGSTAQIAKWLGLPVILVLDAWSLGRSAAALIQGYESFDPDLNVAGVIFNKIAGGSHLDWLRQAVESSCQAAILGGIPKVKEVEVPERHLGLLMSYEDKLPSDYIEELADLISEHLDLKKLLSLSELPHSAFATAFTNESEGRSTKPHGSPPPFRLTARIGVARDEAFCFYYEDNLDVMREAGAEIVAFSPLSDSRFPADLDALYLGGGYPELYAKKLAGNNALLEKIRQFSNRGGIVYGECGGLMYLSQGIEDLSGNRFPLCGVFPFWTRMVSKLKLAYAEIQTTPGSVLFPPNQKVRGHLFHFSEMVQPPDLNCGYQVKTFSHQFEEGFQVKKTLVSYIHLHFGSNPQFARTLLSRCHDTNRRLR